MKFEQKEWRVEWIDTMEIQLDPDNARVGKSNPSPDVIVNHLIEFEDIIGLAKQISDYGALFTIERILVAMVNGKPTVLEGNRRVCACQILLRPTMYIHDRKQLQQIPLIDDATRKQISTLESSVVEIRDLGDPIVANVHASAQKRPWLPINQMKWAYLAVKRGENLQDIADYLKLDISEVQPLIRGFRAVEYARSGQMKWSAEEEQILLADHKIDFQPYLRVVLSSTAAKHFGTPLFLDIGEPNFTGHPKLLPEYIKIIARHSLIAQSTHQEDRLDRKSNIENYLNRYFPKNEPDELGDLFGSPSIQIPITPGYATPATNTFKNPIEQTNLPDAPNAGSPPAFTGEDRDETRISGEPVKTERFFEYFETPNNSDTRIKLILRELRRLSRSDGGIDQFPLSYSMLVRALLEWSLTLHLRRIGVWDKLKKSGYEPRLAQVLKHCGDANNKIFNETKISALVNNILNRWLDDLNWNAHSDMGNITKPRLQEISGDVLPLVRHLESIGSLEKLSSD